MAQKALRTILSLLLDVRVGLAEPGVNVPPEASGDLETAIQLVYQAIEAQKHCAFGCPDCRGCTA